MRYRPTEILKTNIKKKYRSYHNAARKMGLQPSTLYKVMSGEIEPSKRFMATVKKNLPYNFDTLWTLKQ